MPWNPNTKVSFLERTGRCWGKSLSSPSKKSLRIVRRNFLCVLQNVLRIVLWGVLLKVLRAVLPMAIINSSSGLIFFSRDNFCVFLSLFNYFLLRFLFNLSLFIPFTSFHSLSLFLLFPFFVVFPLSAPYRPITSFPILFLFNFHPLLIFIFFSLFSSFPPFFSSFFLFFSHFFLLFLLFLFFFFLFVAE